MRPRMRIAVGTAIGVAALGLAFLWRGPAPSPDGQPDTAREQRPRGTRVSAVDRSTAERDPLEARIARLESRLESEVQRAERLQERLDELATTLASDAAAEVDAAAAAGTDPGPPAGPTPPHITGTESGSPLEQALQAAGLDATTAEGIKRRGDEIAMMEMYLRDQATREGWVDSPRFEEEMEAIEQQRTSIREEIGDDSYDRYLFALGHTNRVIVNDVMFQSVAEEAGLQNGDLILRYGDAMLFAPNELVEQTHSGSPGETVTLEVMRGGKRIEVQVPRGPLGLRIGPAQDHPG